MGDARNRRITRALFSVLGLNLLVAGLKAAVGFATGSVAIRADALHSGFDALANVVGLLAMRAAADPPDAEHPYGHHRFELLGAVVIGALILAAAVGIALDAMGALTEPAAPSVDGSALITLLLAAGIAFGVSRWERRIGRELGSPVLIADSGHTATDFLGTAVVFAASVGIWLGARGLDIPAAAIVVVLIGRTAFQILRSTGDVLLERAAVDADAVERAACAVPGVLSVHKVRSRGSPGAVFVDLHIQVDPDESVRIAHDRSGAVKAAIRAALPDVRDVLVHIEPKEP